MSIFKRKVKPSDIVSKYQTKATKKAVRKAVDLSIKDQNEMLKRAAKVSN